MYSLDYSDALLLYYLFFAKIIPLLVTFLFEKYLNIKIKFKSISLFHACIENISVKLPGYEITVGEIGLKTRYLSSDYKKPLCIKLEDVKINQSFEVDLEAQARRKHSKEDECKVLTNGSENVVAKRTKYFFEKALNNLLQYLPPTAMILAQFLGIRIKNFSTTVLNKEKGPLASLNVPNLELTFDGCVVKNSRTLFIALALQHIRKLNVSVSSTQVTFYGGLFDMIEHFMLHMKLHKSSELSIESEAPPETLLVPSKASLDVEKLFETITPDLMIIHVENTEVKSFNKHNSYHYHLLLQHIELKGRFKSSSTSRMKISNLRIYTPANEVLYSKELLIDVKFSENLLVIGIKLDTLHLVYTHDDIYGWFVKIFTAGMKSNRKELIVRAFCVANEKAVELYHSEFTQNLFKQIILNIKLELRDTRLVLQLPDQVSSLNVSKANFELHQSKDLRNRRYEDYTLNLILQDRHWRIELSSEGPLCWYMDEKFDFLRSENKKTYVRGSAVFLGSAVVNLNSDDDSLELKLRVNTLRAEYSQKLTSFTVKSIKSFKEYIALFSQLKSKSDNEANLDGRISISIEKVLNEIKLDAKVANISFFFINRHDVCAFVNIADFTSIDSFNYTVDSLQVSTIDFSKYDSIYDLTEFSSVYINTKSLNISLDSINDQPQLGVDFTEHLDCSWNAHFLRHLLSLLRDVHGFRRNIRDALGHTSSQTSLIPHSLPVGLDIKKLRNISIKHADVNVDKLILLINELSGENLFFYHYFN